MATIVTNVSRQFKDLDLRFTRHPLKKDVSKNLDQVAVIYAIKNLILTNHYEKPFNPDYGSTIFDYLFAQGDQQTELDLNEEIADVIRKYEPRVTVVSIDSKIDENSGIEVTIEYYVQNSTELQTLTTNITRTT